MCVVLIFPPGVDPRGPHLALPSLAASLRQAGETVHLVDANLEAVRHLLQADRVQRAGSILRGRTDGRDPATPLGRLGLSAGHLARALPDALAVFDDPERFYDARELASAREILCSALELVSAAHSPRIRFNINPARYDVSGCDPRSLDALIEVAADRALNLFADFWERELLPRLAGLKPLLVGISITNRQQLIPGLMLARRLRQAGHFTVIGGTVFTKFDRSLRQRPQFFRQFADALVLYEGETALRCLVQQLRGARDLAAVPNLLYRQDERVRAGPTWVEDIDRLPTPDFDGLDLQAYLAPSPVLPILTGKGCYFNRCRFCDIPYINHVSRKAYRVRRPDLIAADIRRLRRRHGCRHFVITDEALSPRLLLKLAEALSDPADAGLNFTGYARLEPGFTAATCQRLARMGLRKLYFGLESADQATLDHMDKGARVSEAPTVLAHCADAGIRVHLFSIIGFPQESAASARTTLQFFLDHRRLLDHPGNSFDIHPFGLELRTDYYRDRERLGLEVDAAAVAGDFVIGLEGHEWNNRDGLSGAEVERLLREEFHPALRARYRRHHATAENLWPGFEEYAVLYCERYAGRDFPYPTALPNGPAGTTGHLRWNPAVATRGAGDRVLLLARDGFRLLEGRVHQALDGLALDRIGPDLARRLMGPAGTAPDLRQFIDRLIARGLVQLSLDAPGSAPRWRGGGSAEVNSELADRD